MAKSIPPQESLQRLEPRRSMPIASDQSLRIVHTNDFHGHLTHEIAEQIRELRGEHGLYFDCGDLISAGNLSVSFQPDPAWRHLAYAGCTASVLGNRETHPVRRVFEKKIEGVSHPILVANMFRDGKPVFPSHKILNFGDFRVGVFGLMIPMMTERSRLKSAWEYRWTQPLTEVRDLVTSLRRRVDLLIAITHLGLSVDRQLARAYPEIDLILGGHSHDALTSLESASVIAQAGSHGRYAGVYDWQDGRFVDSRLVKLG